MSAGAGAWSRYGSPAHSGFIYMKLTRQPQNLKHLHRENLHQQIVSNVPQILKKHFLLFLCINLNLTGVKSNSKLPGKEGFNLACFMDLFWFVGSGIRNQRKRYIFANYVIKKLLVIFYLFVNTPKKYANYKSEKKKFNS